MTLPLLHPLFSNHAVLQRHQPIPVWGWAKPGETVTARLGDHTQTATAAADGRWQVTFAALGAGGPYRLAVSTAGGVRTVIDDLLVGEVWLCSGQSNMEWPASSPAGLPDELLADQPAGIRLFRLPKVSALDPQPTAPARWQPASVESIAPFSAIGYAFGLELHRRLGVPVGLIHSAWGGTVAAAWVRREALEAHPELRHILASIPTDLVSRDDPAYNEQVRRWRTTAFHVDTGRDPATRGWEAPDHDDSGWDRLEAPGYWETQGWDMDGAVWYRREVTVPEDWFGNDLQLDLGPIDDFDETFVNGVRVGGIACSDNPDAYLVPRSYTVPGRLVTGTRVVVAVRVFDHLGNGGFAGAAQQMRLHRSGGGPQASVPLAGTWKARIERKLPSRGWTPPPSCREDNANMPSGLWNAMIAPLVPYALQGALWYQGESNAGNAAQYRPLLTTLVTDWRRAWGRDLPFLAVQLCAWKPRATEPVRSEWAELRAAQAAVMDALPACGLAVTCDSGDAADIHPANKALVAHRLALLARAQVYGEDVPHRSPSLIAAERRGNRVVCRIRDGLGLVALGGQVQTCAIAGADGRWQWAQARIDTKTQSIELWHPAIPEPTAVSYGWADNPAVNVVNAWGLPLRPFQAAIA